MLTSINPALVALCTDSQVLPPEVLHLRRDGFTLVRTPAMPSFWEGNMLVLDEAPRVGSLTSWVEQWHRIFAGSGAERVMVRWEMPLSEDPEAWTTETAAAGLDLAVDETLIHPSANAECASSALPRRLSSAEDWRALLELEAQERQSSADDAFLQWQIDGYRRIVEAARGEWWGVFEGSALIGSAGIFWCGPHGRFQMVTTRGDRRGQGTCTRLCRQIFSRCVERAVRPVIVAERASNAERLYRRLGFVPFSWRMTASAPLTATVLGLGDGTGSPAPSSGRAMA